MPSCASSSWPPAPSPAHRSSPSSSAAARPPCWIRPIWPGSWTASTPPGDWPPAPRSPPKPTRSRSIPPRSADSGTPGSPGSRSACSRPPRASSKSWTAGTPPGRAPQAATEAREAGFDHVNLDLIYGTPGETPEEFATSLDTAIRAGVDHVSAYSLIVEDGTRMAARMRRGELPYPSDDVAADRYLAAETALTAAGFAWYEVSNWATSEAARCRHNLRYWTGGDWWGLGPGAHSHVGGVRWWNVKHPAAYASRLAAGTSPGHGRELLTPADQHVEDVMLRVRLSDGLPLDRLEATGRRGAAQALAHGSAGCRRVRPGPDRPDVAGPAAGRCGGARPAAVNGGPSHRWRGPPRHLLDPVRGAGVDEGLVVERPYARRRHRRSCPSATGRSAGRSRRRRSR